LAVTKFRAGETDLIGDDSSRASELVQQRAIIDLLTGKLTRGHQELLDAETAAQPIGAFKQSAISAYFQNFESVLRQIF
jgi:hypothetical protein